MLVVGEAGWDGNAHGAEKVVVNCALFARGFVAVAANGENVLWRLLMVGRDLANVTTNKVFFKI